MKKFLTKQSIADKTNIRNIRKIFLKIFLGIAIIAGLFFVAVNFTHEKFARLSEKVSDIKETNIKLIKLKEISNSLYNASINVKAYALNKDTTYLHLYENEIKCLNKNLDTLFLLSNEGHISDSSHIAANQLFSVRLDSLTELTGLRIILFNEYIEFKTGNEPESYLKILLKDIKLTTTDSKSKNYQNKNPQDKSFLARLFSKKNNSDKSKIVDSPESETKTNDNLISLINKQQDAEKIKTDSLLSEEMGIIDRENGVANNIFSLLKSMEEAELKEGIKRIRAATDDTTAKISLISNWLIFFGLLLTLFFSYFIYRDIVKSKRFKEQILVTKRNVEKAASKYSLSLIEASQDPLLAVNSEGKITDVNQATVNITGLSREELKGTFFLNYFTDSHIAESVYKEVFEKGFVADSLLTIKHKNGKLTEVLFNGSVYKDDLNNVLGVVVVARDITKQKIFENELIVSKNSAESATLKAEESTKLIEAFLANMSHEIRTPMNAIMGFSDLLAKRNLGETEKEFVSIIKSAGEKLLTIINDILDISKIESGMMTFETDAFSIKETFKSLSVLLMQKAKAKNIDLVFSFSDDVPDILLGDHTRLTQIIINLVDNAIKFTKTGSVKMHASIRNQDTEKTTLEFIVTDTGIGIAPDKLKNIFNRFSQAEEHITRTYGGTGLGLSIAKQLVELQGGELTVKSEPGTGSEFSFFIPFLKTSQEQIEAETIHKKYNLEDLQKLNILLVEDHFLNIKLIKCLFDESELNLQIAENGSLALDKIKENNFDIILMDMEMPVMNGYQATIEIRQVMKNDIPIIAMTAHAMAGEKERCLNLGMNDYISKPINSILLFEKMYDLTNKSKKNVKN